MKQNRLKFNKKNQNYVKYADCLQLRPNNGGPIDPYYTARWDFFVIVTVYGISLFLCFKQNILLKSQKETSVCCPEMQPVFFLSRD